MKEKPFNIDKELRRYRWHDRKAKIEKVLYTIFNKLLLPIIIGGISGAIGSIIAIEITTK